MLGGGSNLLIGDLIEMQFLGNSYNPNLGAAISLVLMVIILLIMTILNQFDDDEDTEEYKIVGRMEADLADGKISFGSPLGQAIMKKEAGTTSTVEAPAGEYKVTIVEVK